MNNKYEAPAHPMFWVWERLEITGEEMKWEWQTSPYLVKPSIHPCERGIRNLTQTYPKEYVDILLSTLKEKDQRIEALHQQAVKDGNLIVELEQYKALNLSIKENLASTIKELEQRLQQPIKLPPLMPEDIFGGTPQAHMVANSHNNAITACSMSIRDAGFKSECTVWKEAKE